MRPISSLSGAEAAKIRYVLMDIDDTLTKDGLLLEESYAALWKLRESGFKVVPVTGRPAGWCDLIAREWPVDGVVGENGAFAFYLEDGHLKQLFHPGAVKPEPGGILDTVKRRALAEVPGSRIAKDQFGRIYDLAVDFAEEEPILGLDAAKAIRDIAVSEGARAKISSIHVNAWLGDYDKLAMSELFLSSRFGWDPILDSATVMFFGDSPNDEPMFARFPFSCAVANFSRYSHLVRFLPGFLTKAEFGYGFAEGIDVLTSLSNMYEKFDKKA
jgi:HAD superfamily hydrolase (TIGR01484 family)